MSNKSIFVSDLSTSTHIFHKYHFCRGNSNQRKSRLGVILKGSGTYIYLNQRLKVSEGDVVFIPENIYCFSEWYGEPEIKVVYLSCFMHYENYTYRAQIVDVSEDIKTYILQIAELLSENPTDTLEAYSRFYRLLQSVIPQLKPGSTMIDKTLEAAIGYITENWNKDFSVADIARKCCVSESSLYHLFQRNLGQTPIGFVNSIRINVAIEHLENSSYSVSKICELVGFHSENHFRKVFSDSTGTTPLKFRKNV